jgi:Gpi18-like mannosyltransferase
MMLWVLAALVATLIAAYFIVEWTVRRYGGQ